MEMSRKKFCAPSVQVAQMVEEIIGCKWAVSVISCVRKGIVRPGAMERSIVGVSTKVLNQRLRRFIAFGILEKKVYQESPYHVEYWLTNFGEQFVRVVDLVDELQHFIDRRSTDSRLLALGGKSQRR